MLPTCSSPTILQQTYNRIAISAYLLIQKLMAIAVIVYTSYLAVEAKKTIWATKSTQAAKTTLNFQIKTHVPYER